jgi:hypothetical protein
MLYAILTIITFPLALGIALVLGALFFRIRDGHW